MFKIITYFYTVSKNNISYIIASAFHILSVNTNQVEIKSNTTGIRDPNYVLNPSEHWASYPFSGLNEILGKYFALTVTCHINIIYIIILTLHYHKCKKSLNLSDLKL